MDKEDNLLYGVLALQLGKVTPAQIMSAAGSWAVDPSRDLLRHLVDAGLLSAQDRTLILDLASRERDEDGGIDASSRYRCVGELSRGQTQRSLSGDDFEHGERDSLL